MCDKMNIDELREQFENNERDIYGIFIERRNWLKRTGYLYKNEETQLAWDKWQQCAKINKIT